MRKIIILIFITILLSGCETPKERFTNHLSNDLHFNCNENVCSRDDENHSKGNGASVVSSIEENINLNENTYNTNYKYVVTNEKKKTISKSSWSFSFNYENKKCVGVKTVNKNKYEFNHESKVVILNNKDKYNCKKTNNKDIKDICEYAEDKCLEMKNNFVSISKGYDIEDIINNKEKDKK